MTIYTQKGTHEFYTEVDRHWSPLTESFTGADSLLTAQRNGWHLVGLAYREEILFGAARRTTIYHFELTRDDETVYMPVVSNPFVVKMLHTYQIDVLPKKQAQSLNNTVDTLLKFA